MSATLEAPARRGRPPRVEATERRRRRRNPGNLDVMIQTRLNFIDPSYLDPDYVYRWINDEGGRLRQLTRMDDYDFVTSDMLGDGFDEGAFDQESDGRLRVEVETRNGKPLYAYLCRKPRAFWEADYDEMVRYREDTMAARVYRAEATEDDETRDSENFYAAKGNVIGGAAERRRGPIPRRIK